MNRQLLTLRKMDSDRQRARLADLWSADAEALARFFPTDGEDAFDRSRADSALLSHLAYWTGKDQARMERLWRCCPTKSNSSLNLPFMHRAENGN